MIVNIHNKKHFDKKLFCNGIIPLSPEKSANSDISDEASATTSGTSSPVPKTTVPASSSTQSSQLSPLPPPISPLSSSLSPSRLHDIGQLSKIPETPDTNLLHADLNLIRRHSLSLRSPPIGSLADDIIRSSHLQTQRIQAMMSDVKESLSDFGSCMGSSSSSESDEEKDLFKTVERKKSGKKRKNPVQRILLEETQHIK